MENVSYQISIMAKIKGAGHGKITDVCNAQVGGIWMLMGYAHLWMINAELGMLMELVKHVMLDINQTSVSVL